jgi:hypothetical protein
MVCNLIDQGDIAPKPLDDQAVDVRPVVQDEPSELIQGWNCELRIG